MAARQCFLKATPLALEARRTITGREIKNKLRSAQTIQKITKTMNMVSTARYRKAAVELVPAREYGLAARKFYTHVETEQKPRELVIAISSDRGLCGAVHTNVCKKVRAHLLEEEAKDDFKLVTVGDKAKQQLQRTHKNHMLLNFQDIGRKPATMQDAHVIAEGIYKTGFEFDRITIVYNKFKSVVSYEPSTIAVPGQSTLAESQSLLVYDSLDDEVVKCYCEFSLASLLLFALKEGATSEISSRMNAMDAAASNAKDMIRALELQANRVRQAVITTELIEIISGAASL